MSLKSVTRASIFWGFVCFFFFNCSGEFQITVLAHWGTHQGTDWTVAAVVRTSVVMNISFLPWKVSSNRREMEGNGCSQQKRDSE